MSVLDASLNELITPILSKVFEPIHVCYQNKIDILCLINFFLELAAQLVKHLLTTFKKWCYTVFTLSIILSVCLSLCHSVIIRFFFNILRIKGQNLNKLFIHIIIDMIYVGIVNHCFSQICNRVTALDSCRNFVFCQYLQNELTESDQILYTYGRWYCKSLFFANKFASESWPLIHFRIRI